MAVNSARSMNQDLYLGSQVDGFLKTWSPDRGGEVEEQALAERAQNLQSQYGVAHMGHSFACSCSNCK